MKDELGYKINDGIVRLFDLLGYCNLYKIWKDGNLEDTTKSQMLLHLPKMNLLVFLHIRKFIMTSIAILNMRIILLELITLMI